MIKTSLQLLRKPHWLFVLCFIVIALAELLFGETYPSDFIPTFGGFDQDFFSVIWFCAAIAIVSTGLIAALFFRRVQPAWPWILAAITTLAFFTIIVQAGQDFGRSEYYHNYFEAVYEPLRHTVPYYYPFIPPSEYDYMLFTSFPVFLKASAFLAAPLAIGYTGIYLRKWRQEDPS